MDYTITVTGIDELIKKCNDPAVLGEPFRDFLTKSTKDIQRLTQTYAPKDTGELAGSITTLVDAAPMPLWGETGTILPYAPYMEYGTPPHWMPIAAITGWAHRHGMNPYAIQRKIAKYGLAPRYFLRTAILNSWTDISNNLTDMARAIEDRWSAK